MSDIVVVDYGLGNLFSIQQACRAAGLESEISSGGDKIDTADCIVLPGVGAFGDAMAALKKRDLISPIKDFAQSGRPIVGICLGLQLLMTESHEFGIHKGLGLIEGEVVRFDSNRKLEHEKRYKVPQVGWNRISKPIRSLSDGQTVEHDPWAGTLLEKVPDGSYMYFLHSFYVVPADQGVVLAETEYAGVNFCSTLAKNNIFACQFHPEKSGERGLFLYKMLAERIGLETKRSSVNG
jgi:glutamine amidotransferase